MAFSRPWEDDGDGILLSTGKFAYGAGKSAFVNAPSWAPRIVSGKLARAGKGAYDAVAQYNRLQAQASARSHAAASRIARQNAEMMATARSIANKAKLASKVAQNRAADAVKVAKTTRATLAQVQAMEASARRSEMVKLGLQKAPAYRRAAALSPGNAARIRSNADFDFARGVKNIAGTPDVKAAVDLVKEERNALAGALRSQRSTKAAADAARKAATEAAEGVGRAAGEAAKRLNAGKKLAYDQVMARAKPTTSLQRGVFKVTEGVKSAAGAVKDVASGAKNLVKAAGRAVWRSEVPKAAKVVAKAEPGIVRRAAGWVGHKLNPATSMNAIERAGLKLTAGKAGLGVKAIRAMTNASSLAGSFASGAWIDAGMKAYDFYSNGGSIKKGLYGSHVETVNGKTVKVRDGADGLTDVVFSREYLKEALKGLQSTLTLGFFGQGDDTVIDNWLDSEEYNDQQNARLNSDLQSQDASLKDIHGNRVYTDAEVQARANAVNGANARAEVARKLAAEQRLSASEENFMTLFDQAVAARKGAYDTVAKNVNDFENFSKANARALRGKSASAYESEAKGKADADFKRSLGYLMTSAVAKDVIAKKKAAAYMSRTGGRVYDEDVQKLTSDSQDRTNMLQFNMDWADMSDEERISWSKEKDQEDIDRELKALQEQEVQ